MGAPWNPKKAWSLALSPGDHPLHFSTLLVEARRMVLTVTPPRRPLNCPCRSLKAVHRMQNAGFTNVSHVKVRHENRRPGLMGGVSPKTDPPLRTSPELASAASRHPKLASHRVPLIDCTPLVCNGQGGLSKWARDELPIEIEEDSGAFSLPF